MAELCGWEITVQSALCKKVQNARMVAVLDNNYIQRLLSDD